MLSIIALCCYSHSLFSQYVVKCLFERNVAIQTGECVKLFQTKDDNKYLFYTSSF